MALDRTSGFDMLLQISENELNGQLAAGFAIGLLFPASLISPLNAFGVTGRFDLNFGTPVADLDRPRPQVGLTVPFNNSQLEVTTPTPTTKAPLGGRIVIVDSAQMRTVGATQQAVLDFADGAPTVTATFDAASVALLTPELSAMGVSIEAMQNELADSVRNTLGAHVVPLSPQIDVADDTDPLSPFDIDVTTVNDTSAADRDALTFGVRTDASSGGNINGVTVSFIPPGAASVLMMSNFWLLARVMRPRLATALSLPVTDFDTPLRLNRSVAAPGGQGTLTNLEARVDGNRIRVDGRATASGTGWSAVSTFHFFIDLTLAGGAIQVTATAPEVDTKVHLEWWVWLAGLGLGALFGRIIAALVAVLVGAVTEAIAEGIAETLMSDAFSSATGNIPPLPLGPLGTGLTTTALLLDDLELRGTVHRSLGLPIKSTGKHASAGAFTLDLDEGVIRPGGSTLPSLDLSWDPATGLHTMNGAGLTVSGWPYGALTPVELRGFGFGTTHLTPATIPFAVDVPIIGVTSEIVCGVRTSRGRLAKIRAWRDAAAGGLMRIYWTTYATPIPTLDIATRWEVIETGESTSYIGRDFAVCSRTQVRRRLYAEAWPRLVTFPVNYQWCLCGTVLTEGEGEAQVEGGGITWRTSGRYLTLETEMGGALDCDLCVSAIDARNRELFTCVHLKVDGIEDKCGKGKKFYPKPKYEIVPCDPLVAISKWESVMAPRVQEQLVKALAVGVRG